MHLLHKHGCLQYNATPVLDTLIRSILGFECQDDVTRPVLQTPPPAAKSLRNLMTLQPPDTLSRHTKYTRNINIYTECPRRNVPDFGENVPYVKVHRSNPKHLYPKLNGYGDNSERKRGSSCGSTYCTCFACRYPYTAHVRPSVSQPSQAHSAFIINRCHSYSEL